jgi:hypothetical protein
MHFILFNPKLDKIFLKYSYSELPDKRRRVDGLYNKAFKTHINFPEIRQKKSEFLFNFIYLFTYENQKAISDHLLDRESPNDNDNPNSDDFKCLNMGEVC